MKNKLCIIIILLALGHQYACAQKHMKFMGIFIDEDVSLFCKELEQKGFSKGETIKGSVSFNGLFYGQDSFVDVKFDPYTRIVYNVSVSIIKEFEFELAKIQKEIMDAIEVKYMYKKQVENAQLQHFSYYIYEGIVPVGIIQTFIFDPRLFGKEGDSMLSISYYDVENYLKMENKKRNDI